MKSLFSINKLFNWICYFLLFLLPTQLGKFFFIQESYIFGIRIDYLAPVLYLTDIIVFVLIILYVLLQIHKKRPNITIAVAKHLNVKLGLLFLSILFNIFYSLSPIVAIYKYVKLIELGFVFYIFKKSNIHEKKILIIFLLSTFIQLAITISQIQSQGSMQGIFYFLGERSFQIATPGIAKIAINGIELLRGYGTFSHPNSLSGFYLLIYGFVLWHAPFAKHTLLRFFLLTALSLIIFLSFSKITILGFLILTIYHSIKAKNSCFVCKIAKIFIPLVLTLIFISGVGDPDSLYKRLWLIDSSVQIIKQHPIFGVGLGNYLLAQSKIPIPYPYFFLQPVHNIFLLMLSELGIILSTFIFTALIKIIKINWGSSVFKVLILIIVFTGLFDHYWLTLQQNTLLIPVVFGLLQKHKSMVK